MRDIIYCEKCEHTGKLMFLLRTVTCFECMGYGFFTLEHLRQVRSGRSVRRVRKRFWLKINDAAKIFGLGVVDWKRIEYGHFSVEYTLDVYRALKRYTDSLEKLPFYSLIQNPKSRRKGFEELLTSYNKVVIDKEVERLKLKLTDYQIVVQELYAENLTYDG